MSNTNFEKLKNVKNSNALKHQQEQVRPLGEKSRRQNRLLETADFAKEAKRKAQDIVLNFIERGLSTQYFSEKICYITPDNYDDVIVERAIAGLCGYPLCDASLPQNFKNQTYIIRHNKVYDITERRNFCSNMCYEASELVKQQIPVTPLYLRATDNSIINFKLLLPDLSSLKGRYGKRFNIQGCSFDLEDENLSNITKNCKDKTKENSPKDCSLNGSSDNSNTMLDYSRNSSSNKSFSNDTITSHCSSSDVDTHLSNEIESMTLHNESASEEYRIILDMKKVVTKTSKVEMEGKQESVSEEIQNPKPINTNNDLTANPLQLIYEIEQALREWMTFDSLRLILGDVYVRGMLEELGKTWDDYDSTSGLRLGMESKLKFLSLCKKLDLEEMKDRVADITPESDEVENKILKPMPDYEQLQKHAQQQSLKVKAFFHGQDEYADDADSSNNLETIEEEEEEEVNKKEKNFAKKKIKKKPKPKKQNDDDSAELPLIDMYAQSTWRRQIFHEKLHKPLSRLTRDLGLNESEIRRLVKPLIASFDLSPHNITFKVIQWELIGIVILKMLCPRYTVVADSMTHGKGLDILVPLLHSFGLDARYLDRLLSYLTELTHILGKYHKETNLETFTTNKDASPFQNDDNPADIEYVKKPDEVNITSPDITIDCDFNGAVKSNSCEVKDLVTGSRNSQNTEIYTKFEELD